MDLNTAPHNWLRGGAATVESQSAADFSRNTSSVSIAEGVLPTLIAERAPVDIISNSQTVKKLLKAPLSKQPISLAVHRIGDTMLIDEFDAAPLGGNSSAGGGSAGGQPVNKAVADFGRHARSQIRAQQRLSATPTTFTLPSPQLKVRKNPAVQKRKNLMSKFLARSLVVDVPELAAAGAGAGAGVGAGGAGAGDVAVVAPFPAQQAVAAVVAAAAAMGAAPSVPKSADVSSVTATTPSFSLSSTASTTATPTLDPHNNVAATATTTAAAASASPHAHPQRSSTSSRSATAATTPTARNHMWTFKDLRCLVVRYRARRPVFLNVSGWSLPDHLDMRCSRGLSSPC